MDHHAEDAIEVRGRRISDDRVEADRLGSGLDDGNRLRVRSGVDHEAVAGASLIHPMQHGHRLRHGGRFIEEGGVGDFHSGQLDHHGLEVEQRLEAALGDFGLVRRVGGVPAGILEDIAADDRWCDGAVVAHPDQRHVGPIALGDGLELLLSTQLAKRFGKIEHVVETNVGGHGAIDQFGERVDTDRREHVSLLVLGWADMA